MEDKTILIVDDNSNNLDILSQLLSEYDVIDTTSGFDALQIVQEEKIDLILLDIVMPQINGFEVCQKLKSNPRSKNIPIIFLTAKTDEDSIEKGFELGAIDFISKPFRPKELIVRIKTQLTFADLQKQQQTYEKQLAMTELLSKISHHWRQPLTVIQATADLLNLKNEMGTLQSDFLSQNLNDIVQVTEKLSESIDQFDGLAIVDSCASVDTFELQSVVDSLNLIFKDIIKLDQNCNNQLNLNLQQFQFIIKAIVENSVQQLQIFQVNDPTVQIKTLKTQDQFIIHIIDNGGGIDENIIDKIFQPYFTTFHESQDKGLTLYLVQCISQQLGGSISGKNIDFIHNNQHYKGACFSLKFPVGVLNQE